MFSSVCWPATEVNVVEHGFMAGGQVALGIYLDFPKGDLVGKKHTQNTLEKREWSTTVG